MNECTICHRKLTIGDVCRKMSEEEKKDGWDKICSICANATSPQQEWLKTLSTCVWTEVKKEEE